jgi:hypothetical protein
MDRMLRMDGTATAAPPHEHAGAVAVPGFGCVEPAYETIAGGLRRRPGAAPEPKAGGSR